MKKLAGTGEEKAGAQCRRRKDGLPGRQTGEGVNP